VFTLCSPYCPIRLATVHRGDVVLRSPRRTSKSCNVGAIGKGSWWQAVLAGFKMWRAAAGYASGSVRGPPWLPGFPYWPTASTTRLWAQAPPCNGVPALDRALDRVDGHRWSRHGKVPIPIGSKRCLNLQISSPANPAERVRLSLRLASAGGWLRKVDGRATTASAPAEIRDRNGTDCRPQVRLPTG
jgi:hypothetical protein